MTKKDKFLLCHYKDNDNDGKYKPVIEYVGDQVKVYVDMFTICFYTKSDFISKKKRFAKTLKYLRQCQ